LKIFEVDNELLGSKYGSSNKDIDSNPNSNTKLHLKGKNINSPKEKNTHFNDFNIYGKNTSKNKANSNIEEIITNKDFENISSGRYNLGDKFIDNIDDILNKKIGKFFINYFYIL